MFSSVSLAANDSVLAELATSGTATDPTFFIYGVLAAIAATSLVTAYLFFGRSQHS